MNNIKLLFFLSCFSLSIISIERTTGTTLAQLNSVTTDHSTTNHSTIDYSSDDSSDEEAQTNPMYYDPGSVPSDLDTLNQQLVAANQQITLLEERINELDGNQRRQYRCLCRCVPFQVMFHLTAATALVVGLINSSNIYYFQQQ